MAGFSYRELAQLQRGAPSAKQGITSGGKATSRLVGVLYGHKGSGKVYNYLAPEGIRVGDLVTPEVTHAKGSRPTYRTLARVVRTQDATGDPAQNTSGHLGGGGVQLKTIGKTDQRSLPGFKAQQTQNPKFTTKQWAREGEARHRAKIDRIMGRKTTTDSTQATGRILENRA